MKYIKISLFLLIMVTLCLPWNSFAQESNLSPLGFQFGINKKKANKIIDSNGKRIVSENKDSKDMRVILMQGVIVELPVDVAGKDVMTELEFYDKKLLSTSLVFASADESEKIQLETEFDQYFVSQYGEPVERDSMLHFTTATWHTPDVMLVLHTNDKDHSVKIQYKYKPGLADRFEDNLDFKRGTIRSDPAKEMFLEGDYSKPTGYDERIGYQ